MINNKKILSIVLGVLLLPIFLGCCKCRKTELLSSWHDGQAKREIVEFIRDSTTPGNKNFLPVEDRIVVFDNDGTLWTEQPLPFQIFFAFDRIKALASEHPEWSSQQPFKAVIEDDQETIKTFHTRDIVKLVAHAHAIEDIDNFDTIVQDWLATARHPRFDKPYTSLVYQPMLEMLEVLRKNEFKIYIVSGGSVEFMRAWAPEVYGIPKEQIIGSTMELAVDMNEDNPVVSRLPKLNWNNDHGGKIVSLARILGKKPAMIFGNSDGDLEMMLYADTADTPQLFVYLDHTDAEREYHYNEETLSGKLVRGRQIAKSRGWIMVDIAKDWKRVYPDE